MADDRRAALLTGARVLVAVTAAAAAVVVPLRAHAIAPRPDELAVGWSLLIGSLLAFRRTSVSAFLCVAGVLWVAVGLAPLGPDTVEVTLARFALVPAALLVCASASLSPRPFGRSVVSACSLALAASAVGGAGAGWVGLLGIALAALIVPVRAIRTPRPTSGLQVGIGLGMVILGLDAAGLLDLSHDMVTAVGLLTLAVGAVAVGWRASAGVSLGGRGISLDGPMELGRALGHALGTAPVTVVFPGQHGTWLDPVGRLSDAGAAEYDVIDTHGSLLARTRPALSLEPALIPDLHRFLRAAGDGARLRAALRRRADELDLSRKRLSTAADAERQRLVSRLEAGPLRRLGTIAAGLRTGPDGRDWVARVAAARGTLDDLVAGLDPVESAGGLSPALTRLADASGAVLSTRGREVDDLDAAAALAIWFACAEALANVRKHAPGARVTIALEASDRVELTVTDEGPGGADPQGSGLRGLAERLALAGGELEVRTLVVGTALVARVPWDHDRGDVFSLMPESDEPATVET